MRYIIKDEKDGFEILMQNPNNPLRYSHFGRTYALANATSIVNLLNAAVVTDAIVN